MRYPAGRWPSRLPGLVVPDSAHDPADRHTRFAMFACRAECCSNRPQRLISCLGSFELGRLDGVHASRTRIPAGDGIPSETIERRQVWHRTKRTDSSERGSVFKPQLKLRETSPAASDYLTHRPGILTVAHKLEASNARVLLAEDSEANQLVMTGFLESSGIELHCVQDGATAVDRIKQGGFEAVLMDIHMPNLDGLSATKLIREHERQHALDRIPIIALTANAYQQNVDASLEAGCDAHLTKPITKDQLLETLAKFLPMQPDTGR